MAAPGAESAVRDCLVVAGGVLRGSYAKVFEGNADSDTVKHSYLEQPITARFLRFQTVHWHSHPSMRVEVVGCQRKHRSALRSLRVHHHHHHHHHRHI